MGGDGLAAAPGKFFKIRINIGRLVAIAHSAPSHIAGEDCIASRLGAAPGSSLSSSNAAAANLERFRACRWGRNVGPCGAEHRIGGKLKKGLRLRGGPPLPAGLSWLGGNTHMTPDVLPAGDGDIGIEIEFGSWRQAYLLISRPSRRRFLNARTGKRIRKVLRSNSGRFCIAGTLALEIRNPVMQLVGRSSFQSHIEFATLVRHLLR
jgi:hypothetical protein